MNGLSGCNTDVVFVLLRSLDMPTQPPNPSYSRCPVCPIPCSFLYKCITLYIVEHIYVLYPHAIFAAER